VVLGVVRNLHRVALSAHAVRGGNIGDRGRRTRARGLAGREKASVPSTARRRQRCKGGAAGNRDAVTV
jgi:hypothetical protein